MKSLRLNSARIVALDQLRGRGVAYPRRRGLNNHPGTIYIRRRNPCVTDERARSIWFDFNHAIVEQRAVVGEEL